MRNYITQSRERTNDENEINDIIGNVLEARPEIEAEQMSRIKICIKNGKPPEDDDIPTEMIKEGKQPKTLINKCPTE